jgi:COP9 signalosome complex subunit 4
MCLKDAKLKQQVAEIHAAWKDFEKAARTLEKINLDNVNRIVSEDEKAALLVQTAEYWFDDDDAVNAEKFINKVAHIMHLVKDQVLQIRYKVCHAKIADSKRNFPVASGSYYQLSN